VFAEEEEEEEEEEEAPKAKKAPAPAAPKAKGPKKQFQGSDKSGVAAGPSAAALSVKAVGAAAFVGGSAFGVSCLASLVSVPTCIMSDAYPPCSCMLPPLAPARCGLGGGWGQAQQKVGSVGYMGAG
jgi:hypothetical protein